MTAVFSWCLNARKSTPYSSCKLLYSARFLSSGIVRRDRSKVKLRYPKGTGVGGKSSFQIYAGRAQSIHTLQRSYVQREEHTVFTAAAITADSIYERAHWVTSADTDQGDETNTVDNIYIPKLERDWLSNCQDTVDEQE